MQVLRGAIALALLSMAVGCQMVSGLDDLEEGSGGAGTTASGTTASTGGTSTTSGPMCPLVTNTACTMGPMLCEGACVTGDLCKVTCPSDPICAGAMSNPMDLPCQNPMSGKTSCEFQCNAGATPNCSSKRILCPQTGGNCKVICDGDGACNMTEIACGAGGCDVECHQGGCMGTTVTCGEGPCRITCPGAMGPTKPTVNPGPSCAVQDECS